MKKQTKAILTICVFALLSSCLLAAPIGQGAERVPDRTYQAIRRLQPRLSEVKAKQYATLFERASRSEECGLPVQLLISIAFHESSLGMSTVNVKTGDYGLMQVNRKNVLRYGLSQDRVEKDAGYSIRFACRLLRENQVRYSAKYPYWLGIYRSGTALWRTEIQANAKRYDQMVRHTAAVIGYGAVAKR